MSIISGIGNSPQASHLLAPVSTTGSVQATNVKQAKDADGDDGAASVGASQSSDAKLSSTAGILLQSLSAPDARAGKVAALQQSIAAGTYNVPVSAVADKLIQSLLG